MTAATRPPAGPPREYHFPEFIRHVMPNGLKVIVAPTHKLPVVTLLAIVDAGAITDPSGFEGLAQITAEALREGTEKKNGIEILEGFERLGSSLEAGADWDSTIVSSTLLSEHLAEGLSLMAEVLMEASFPEHEIARLKAERLAERLQILSEPRGLADESFSRLLYSTRSRYAEPIGGTSSSIAAVTRARVTDFFMARYTPDAVTMIVVGDVDVKHALSLLTDVLGGWNGKTATTVNDLEKESETSRALEIISKSDAAQAELRLGHLGIPRKHPDYFKVVVMNALLGGLFSSRINLNLRERHGYTYGASSYFDWRRNSGPFVISTAVQSEVTADALRECLVEIDAMRREEVSADELSLATNYLDGVFPIRYETTSAIASALANMAIFDLPNDFYNTYRANIRSVTPADVLEAAKTHIHPDRLRGVVVGEPGVIKEPLEKLSFGALSVRAPSDE
jgi:zinc protease